MSNQSKCSPRPWIFCRKNNFKKTFFYSFSDADLAKLCTVLTNTVTIPVHNDAAPYIISTQSDTLLSPLYESVLDVVEFLQKEFLADSDRFGKMLVVLLQQLMIFSKYACIPPSSK